jgi:hypothetical protein
MTTLSTYAGKYDSPERDTPFDNPPGKGRLHNEIAGGEWSGVRFVWST